MAEPREPSPGEQTNIANNDLSSLSGGELAAPAPIPAGEELPPAGVDKQEGEGFNADESKGGEDDKEVRAGTIRKITSWVLNLGKKVGGAAKDAELKSSRHVKNIISVKWLPLLVLASGIVICVGNYLIPGILEAKKEGDVLRRFGEQNLTEGEKELVSGIMDSARLDADYLMSGKTTIGNYLDHLVVLDEGLGSEVQERYRELGVDPKSNPGRDMDVILENPKDWYLFMKANMLALKDEIESGGYFGINAETGEGLALYLQGKYPNEKGVSEGSYSIEALFRASVNQSPLSHAGAQRLKDYVKEYLNTEWRSLREGSSQKETQGKLTAEKIQDVAEWAGINSQELMGGLETLAAETKFNPEEAQAMVSSYDLVDSLYVDKPGGLNFGPETLVLLGLAMVHAGKKSWQSGTNWLKSLAQAGVDSWTKLTKSDNPQLSKEVKDKIIRQ